MASAILQLCYDSKEWQLLNDHITLLCKRRAQLTKVRVHDIIPSPLTGPQVQATVIQMGAGWIESTPDKQTKRKLIDTLRKMSEGKVCGVAPLQMEVTSRVCCFRCSSSWSVPR